MTDGSAGACLLGELLGTRRAFSWLACLASRKAAVGAARHSGRSRSLHLACVPSEGRGEQSSENGKIDVRRCSCGFFSHSKFLAIGCELKTCMFLLSTAIFAIALRQGRQWGVACLWSPVTCTLPVSAPVSAMGYEEGHSQCFDDEE
eukprot:6196554-Pleurochrysis_carterae.AAC.1